MGQQQATAEKPKKESRGDSRRKRESSKDRDRSKRGSERQRPEAPARRPEAPAQAPADVARPDVTLQVSDAAEEEADGPTEEEGPILGYLHVRVHAGHDLVNRDTGLFGDVSDPYVVVKLGGRSARTPTIDDNLNPVWSSDNEFVLPLAEGVGSLSLEVMNSNFVRDDSLGRTSVPIWQLAPDRWYSRREKLEGVKSGELSFEVRVSASDERRSATPTAGRPAAGRPPAQQRLEYPFGPALQQPRGRALLFEGVRVLEITRRTWAAALCGRMMASHGADVVRIACEEKKSQASGMERQVVETAKASTTPSFLHAGKRLAPHDLEKSDDRALVFSELLPGCDILLTDLPADDLDRLQLDHQGLRGRFPGLIYLHASVIGTVADLSSRGVEDAGAFYCLTGLAEQLGHVLGPVGFAAATAASPLFGVACLALLRRRCGCVGGRVELSIFRSGRWCTAVGALTGWVRPPQPDYSFGGGAEPRPPPFGGGLESPAAKFPGSPGASPAASAQAPRLPFGVEGAACVSPAVSALQPLHLRWAPGERPPWPNEATPLAAELPLARVSVLEMSDEYHVSAAALGSMLADLGAQVTKLERPQRPDPWKRTCKSLYEDLNGKKLKQTVNYTGVGGLTAEGGCLAGQAALYRTLADTTMLITNLPLQALDSWGFGVAKLRDMFPHLIIVIITTWGCDDAARQAELDGARKRGQEVHAFWEASGLSSDCFSNLAMPPGLGELAISQHALAGVGLALLRQQRTGTGQLVHVSRHHVGLYCRALSMEVPKQPMTSPLLPAKNGRFLRLLGRGHQPHDAWMLLQALGARSSLWEECGGNVAKVRKKLSSISRDELRRMREELVDLTPQWPFEEIAKRFQDAGINWFVEEMRPIDVEALHKERAQGVEAMRLEHQDAIEEALRMADQSAAHEEAAQEARAQDEAELLRLQHAEQQEREDLAQLQREWHAGIPPEVCISMQSAEGISSSVRGERPDSYCICQILHRERARLQSSLEHGTSRPQWDTPPEVLDGYCYGDTLVFAVFCRDHPVDEAAEPVGGGGGQLILTICKAFNLRNADTGIMGDVSDPYVVAKLGDQEEKTPTINDNLNPVWTSGNQFKFRIGHGDTMLHLRVMNANYVSDDSLGHHDLDLTRLPPEQRTTLRLPLVGGDNAELEVDAFLKPPHPCAPQHELDKHFGRADLRTADFYPYGFAGALPLYSPQGPTGAVLQVAVNIRPRGAPLGEVPMPQAAAQQGSGASGAMASGVFASISSALGFGSGGQTGAAAGGGGPRGPATLAPMHSGMGGGSQMGPGGPMHSGMGGGMPGGPMHGGGMMGPGGPMHGGMGVSMPGGPMQSGMGHSPGGPGSPAMHSGMGGSPARSGVGPGGPAPVFDHRVSVLHVRVNGAHNLKNKDTGMFGDVSDPYVAVKLGGAQHRTPTINNNLNPEWTEQNYFTFVVGVQETTLELKVMNSNSVMKDDDLGSTEIDLRSMLKNEWCRYREVLRDGSGAELEFDTFFKPTASHSLMLEGSTMLYVQVVEARKLRNLDTGMFGDVSDPYVKVRVGAAEHQTPVINDDLNPRWVDGNAFTFVAGDDDTTMEIEVMDSNTLQADKCLGKATVVLHRLDPDQWCRLEEPLVDGDGGVIVLDAFLRPTPARRFRHEASRSLSEVEALGKKAKKLALQLQEAEFSIEWLEDVGGRTSLPMSMEEREWERACGGHNLVIPTWMLVSQTRVAALRRSQQQQPHSVALFPESATVNSKMKAKVKIVSAEGLRSFVGGGPLSSYCVCEIPLKPESQVKTGCASGEHPHWRHTEKLHGYRTHDSVVFKVFATRDTIARVGDGRRDELLGEAALAGDRFFPDGFDGLLPLNIGGRSSGASLRVTAFVYEVGG